MTQSLQVAARERFVDTLPPSRITRRRRATPEQRVISGQPAGQARPFPMLGSSHTFGTYGITLDVPQHGGQVIVVLQRKRLESSLPHVPGRAVMTMISSRMGCQEPLQPTPQVAITVRPEHEMEMVRHQAITEEIDRNPTLGVVHRRHKGVEVRRLVEHRLAAVPAIQCVIDHPANSGSSGPWHPRMEADASLQVKNALCPPLLA